jgi:hypothetical protein
MEVEESIVSIVVGKGGLIVWMWKCFQEENGLNGARVVEGVD